jgi:quercetin dioxygenase-like cupin family protein
MEIRRFGYGHRRPDGPVGSHGVQAAVIHADARGTIAELAFARRSVIEPHTNPNTTWFLVIEGGGFVRVGDETARVFAGEAVLWPAGVVHGASTDLSEMRAIVIELAGADDGAAREILDAVTLALEAGPVDKADGALVDDHGDAAYDPSHGEPL